MYKNKYLNNKNHKKKNQIKSAERLLSYTPIRIRFAYLIRRAIVHFVTRESY